MSGQRPCAVLDLGVKKPAGAGSSVSVELRYQVLELLQSKLARAGTDPLEHFRVVYQVVGHGPFAELAVQLLMEV